MRELTEEEVLQVATKPRLFDGTKWFEFDSISEHEQYINSKVPDPEIQFRELVKDRIEKGKEIVIEYLTDNAKVNLTYEQSLQQLSKFQVVKAFLEVGNLEDSFAIISQTETDEIFTEERKQKYLTMLQ